jgi:hypothetical protein
MVHHYHYSLDEIEGLIPFERDIYVGMINDFIEQEREKQKNN